MEVIHRVICKVTPGRIFDSKSGNPGNKNHVLEQSWVYKITKY